MSLTESEIKKIKKYYNKTFEHSDKQYTYNLLDIIKYVVYWKSLMEENKDKLVNIPQVMQVQQDMVFGYDQLKHISQGDLDDNSPKSIMKRHIAMFTKANNINDDMLVMVNGYIEQYYSFMTFGNYKNPVYLTIAIMILHEKKSSKKQEIVAAPVEEELYYGEEGDSFDYGGDDDFRVDDDDDFF